MEHATPHFTTFLKTGFDTHTFKKERSHLVSQIFSESTQSINKLSIPVLIRVYSLFIHYISHSHINSNWLNC